MFERMIVRVLALIFVGVVCNMSTAYGSAQEAWRALHDLNIPEAKTLFRQELQENPSDVSLMRGMLLAAYFDLDHKTQVDMIDAMIAADPGNPYLVPVFELVAADMSDWGDQLDIMYRLGKALSENGTPPLIFTAYHMMLSYYVRADTVVPDGWFERVGWVPGCWIAGPFENQSNIAAYRDVPFEGAALDTTVVTTGKIGTRVGWTWIDNDRYGDMHPFLAIEDDTEVACQLRTFFELPREEEVCILLGGAFSSRVLLDGVNIHDDPKYRDAVQRGGFRTRLSAGTHELTIIVGTSETIPAVSVSIVNDRYEPVEGISWPRYATVRYGDSIEVSRVHAIFDPFKDFVAEKGQQPDTRYWRAVLYMYNGYRSEIIRELEDLYEQDSLSILESWALYDVLLGNDETAAALEHLGSIKKNASSALVDYRWVSSTIENYEARIGAFVELNQQYPERYELEMLAATKPVLSGDVEQLVANLEAVAEKYPSAVSVQQLITLTYTSLTQDSKAAYESFVKECRLSKNLRELISQNSRYAIFRGMYEEAILHAHTAYRLYPGDGALNLLFEAYDRVQRTVKLIPLLDSLTHRYPYNIENYTLLHQIHTNEGNFENARDMLRKIHEIKPAAVMPYRKLDELHNDAAYDSVFGSTDVLTIWDVEPTEEELADNNFWYLLDRRQKLVFESGMALTDIHYAIVVLDQDAVESMQEYYLGFDIDESYNTLLTARRLRKDQPPLPGTTDGGTVVFQDLEPGDAIEIHYRYWSANSGDLWHEFWDTYLVYSGYYQRQWEYAILTNRDDIVYISQPPAPAPIIAEHCGYRKISWSGEHSKGLQFDLAMLPPYDDIIGKIFITTIPDWITVNNWYLSISEAILGDNPRAMALAEKLTDGIDTEFEKVRALYEYVVLEIPYQTIGFDYHASIPHKPDDVLVNKWGDCKDKGHLLVQMLRQIGIDAHPVLVMTRDNGTDMPVPIIQFNHLIVRYILDGDTLYVDPTGITFPLEYSLDEEITGQPCLPVYAQNTVGLQTLPDMMPDDYKWTRNLRITPGSDGDFHFLYESINERLRAGYSRNVRKGLTPAQVREETEAGLIDSWGITLKLDSIIYDSVNSIDTVYIERSYGTMDLNVQTIGKTTILELPELSFLSKVLPSELVYNGKRDFPVDIHSFIGHYVRRIEFEVPAEYGVPQPLDPVSMQDSLWRFDYGYRWDPDTRILTIDFVLEFSEGLSELDRFTTFAGQVIEAFESPILFMKE